MFKCFLVRKHLNILYFLPPENPVTEATRCPILASLLMGAAERHSSAGAAMGRCCADGAER